MDLVHLRPPPASPHSASQYKLRSVDSGTQLQLLVQQRMLQQKRSLFHRQRGSSAGSPTHHHHHHHHLPRQDSYKRAQIVPLVASPHHIQFHHPSSAHLQNQASLMVAHHSMDDEVNGGAGDERWKSLPSRLATDCQLAERSLLWSQQVTTS